MTFHALSKTKMELIKESLETRIALKEQIVFICQENKDRLKKEQKVLKKLKDLRRDLEEYWLYEEH